VPVGVNSCLQGWLHVGFPRRTGTHDAKIAGVIAYYPYSLATEASVPALILVGDKDD
jgi:hypothetical protein